MAENHIFKSNWMKVVLGVVILSAGILALCVTGHSSSAENTKVHVWQPYSTLKLKQALASQKPVMIDFYAQWCYGCHELDRTVFSNPKFKELFSKVVVLRVDATNINTTSISDVLDQYKVVGLPTVIFLDRKGNEIIKARLEGAGTVDDFNESLQIWEHQLGIKLK